MVALVWDGAGQRLFETGVDRGVLYPQDNVGGYPLGVPWNGLTTVTESPSGAEANPQYADNLKYINLLSAEELGGTIEAFTFPPEFAACDGVSYVNNILVGQQSRRSFGLAYRTLLGNDIMGTDYGYKIHLVYGALASPSEKANATVNDSPEATSFSWEFTATKANVGLIGGTNYKPSASLTIDSTRVLPANLAALELILYGQAGVDPRLPVPADVIALFSGSVTVANQVAPSFVAGTGVITIPTTTGVDYRIDGVIVTGTYTIANSGQTKVVTATPKQGYVLNGNTVDRWAFTKS